MEKKFIYINGKKSVEVEEIKSVGAHDLEKVDCNVYIDGTLHKFENDQENPNKLAYALATKRKKYAEFLNNQFENLIILTGAGSSVGVGHNILIKDVSTERKGRLLAQLWDDVSVAITETI